MALVTDKMIFLHPPKTGGTYARTIIDSLELKRFEVLKEHCKFNEIPKDVIDRMPDGILVWGLVRHPITWYQSRWSHRCVNGWCPENDFDYECVSNDFNKFVNNCLDLYPMGWLTHDYANYFKGIPHRFKQYVGRYEELDNSIKHALIESDTLYCESEYPEIEPVNVSMLDGLSSSEIAVYNKTTFDRVLDVERTIIDRYYNGFAQALDSTSVVR